MQKIRIQYILEVTSINAQSLAKGQYLGRLTIMVSKIQ